MLYFEFENELKFYNLEVRSDLGPYKQVREKTIVVNGGETVNPLMCQSHQKSSAFLVC